MTDEMDRLTAALRDTPQPDPQARDAALRRAMESFDRHQGTAPAPRPTPQRPRWPGLLAGVRPMLNRLTSRPALAATASVAALGLGFVLILPLQKGPPGLTPLATSPQERRQPATEPASPAQSYGQTLAAPPQPLAEAVPLAPAENLQRREEAYDSPVAASEPPAKADGSAPAARAKVAAAPLAQGLALSDSAQTGAATGYAEPVPAPASLARRDPGTEAFANADANPVQVTAENPVSTFSIDVDTASYAIVRSSLLAGALPPPEAVRIEEMVNYFPYSYSAPGAAEGFRPDIEVMQTPWNAGTQLVRIGLQGALPALADRPALNLVFLIDTSGSMQDANKLPLLKQAFRLMLPQLRPEDRVAIVTYAGSAGEVLPPTAASDRAAILGALDRLEAGGSTGGEEGLQLAYRVAEGMAREGAVGRVLLATDGDFNLGLSDPAELETFIAGKRQTGVYLSVLGFGRGNLDDATMQALAQAGNGTAAYIDTAQEARKVLVDQLTGALFPIADDVKIQVEWNPAAVAEWRLIGYETRALKREDFNNDQVDAGEIGAGTAVTALYEVAAPGSPALRNDPLRYGKTPVQGDAAELGFLRLRWKAPEAAESALIEVPIRAGDGPAGEDTRFAAAIAGFGQLLTASPYLDDWGWDQAVALAEGARGRDPYGYRAEAITLMRLAQSLAAE